MAVILCANQLGNGWMILNDLEWCWMYLTIAKWPLFIGEAASLSSVSPKPKRLSKGAHDLLISLISAVLFPHFCYRSMLTCSLWWPRPPHKSCKWIRLDWLSVVELLVITVASICVRMVSSPSTNILEIKRSPQEICTYLNEHHWVGPKVVPNGSSWQAGKLYGKLTGDGRCRSTTHGMWWGKQLVWILAWYAWINAKYTNKCYSIEPLWQRAESVVCSYFGR